MSAVLSKKYHWDAGRTFLHCWGVSEYSKMFRVLSPNTLIASTTIYPRDGQKYWPMSSGGGGDIPPLHRICGGDKGKILALVLSKPHTMVKTRDFPRTAKECSLDQQYLEPREARERQCPFDPPFAWVIAMLGVHIAGYGGKRGVKVQNAWLAICLIKVHNLSAQMNKPPPKSQLLSL